MLSIQSGEQPSASDSGDLHLLKENEQACLAAGVENSDDAIIVQSPAGIVFSWNDAARRQFGYSAAEVVGQPISMVMPAEHSHEMQDIAPRIAHGDQVRGRETIWRRKDGSLVNVSLTVSPVKDRRGNVIGALTVVRDITDRKRAEQERAATVELLRLLNSTNDLHALMREVTVFLRDWSGCDAVGIRLREGEDYPYFETRGFPEDFVLAENQLCARDSQGELVRDGQGNPVIECMCGNVICGRFDPSKPFFTANGSFWANSTTRLLASTSEADRQSRTRNRCNGEGYESVALIPLRTGTETFGLLQFNDKREGRFSPEMIAFLEGVGVNLAIGLAQRRTALALRESERRFRNIAWFTVDWESWVGIDGKPLWVNASVERITGYTVDECLAMPDYPLQLIYEADRAAIAGLLEKAVQGSVINDHRFRLRRKDGCTLWVSLSAQPMCDAFGKCLGYRSSVRDIDEHTQIERLQHKTTELLDAILQAQALHIAKGGQKEVFGKLLETLVALTESEYGFLDEVCRDEHGELYKVNLAMSDISWDAASQVLYQQLVSRDLQFRDLNNLAGQPALTGQLVISNHPSTDTRSGGLPNGHPSLNSFMGIPMYFGGELVGVAGVANRPGGYSQEIAAFLTPFTATAAGIIDAARRNRKERQVAQALRESEQNYRRIVETANEGIWSMDDQKRTTYVNPRMAEMLGCSPADMIGRPVTDFMFEDDLPAHNERMSGRFKGSSGKYEQRFRRADETAVWCIVCATPVMDEAGRCRGSFAMFTDITDRKRAEEALAVEKANLKAVFESSPVGMALLDSECRIALANESLAAAFRVSPDAIVQQRCGDLLGCTHANEHPEGCGFSTSCPACRIMRSIREGLEQGAGARGVETQVTLLRDGNEYRPWLQFSIQPLLLAGRRHVVMTLEDVTDRKRAETLLSTERDLALSLMNVEGLQDALGRIIRVLSSIDGIDVAAIYLRDGDGNLYLAAHTGLSPAFIAAESFYPADSPHVGFLTTGPSLSIASPPDACSGDAVRREGIRVLGSIPIAADGRVVAALNVGSMSHDCFPPGMPQALEVIATQIGSAIRRERAEQTLRESEERLRLAVNATNDVVWDWDIVNDSQRWNESGTAVFGWTDIVERPQTCEWWAARVHPDDRQRVIAGFDAVVYSPLQVRWQDEYRFRKVDGSYAIVLDRGYVMRNQRGQAVRMIGAMLDISERKRAEQALRESEEKARAILNATTAAVVLIDRQGIVLDTNQVHAARLNLDREDLLGRCVFDLFTSEVAERRRRAVESVFTTGQPLRFEDERQGRWNDVQIHPVFDAQGVVQRVAVHAADVTDRKRAEHAAALEEKRIEALLALTAMDAADPKAVADFTLGKAVELTASTMGFLGFITEDQSTMVIHAWSDTAMRECAIRDKPIEFCIADAGLWGEMVRQRKPIIVNEYDECAEHKKGYPQGHVRIRRFLGVPIFEKDRITVVVAVANREQAYTEHDVRQLTLLTSGMWRQIQRKRAEQALMESENRYRSLFGESPLSIWETDCSAVKAEFDRLRLSGVTDPRACFTEHSETLRRCASLIRIVETNRESLRLFGVNDKEDISRHLLSFFTDESWPVFAEVMAALAEGETRFDSEIPIIDLDGRRRILDLRLSVAPGHAEALDRVLVSFLDITGRKEAEAALLESDARLREAIKAGNVGLWDWDLRTNRVYYSPEWKRQIGYEDHEISHSFEEWRSRVHPEDIERCLQSVHAFIEKPWPAYSLEFRFRHKDGSYRWIVAQASVSLGPDGRPERMLGSHMDITERKRAEEGLRENEERYRVLVETATDAIFVADANTGILIDANRRAEELLGRPRGEIIGMHQSQLHPPEDSDGYAMRFRKAVGEQGETFHEVFVVRADGRRVPVEISSGGTVRAGGRDIHFGLFRDISDRKRAEQSLREKTEELDRYFSASPDLLVIADVSGYFRRLNPQWEKTLGYQLSELEGKRFLDLVHPDDRDATLGVVADLAAQKPLALFANRYRHRDGSYRWIEWQAHPAGELIYAAARDITQRKNEEQERAKFGEQLRQVQKLEALGHLSAGLAHDFGNLLAVIRGQAAAASQNAGDPRTTRQAIETIEDAAGQATDIVRSLLTFSREIPSTKQRVDLGRLLDEFVLLLRHSLPRSIALDVTNECRGPVWLLADVAHLQQVILNLAFNARDAMPQGGRLGLSVAQTPTADDKVSSPDSRPGEGWVRISVSDTGCGIPEEVRDRVFEPFFTTKPRGQGTGLGLSIVHGIVQDHGGTIRIESGRGTTFIIDLPCAGQMPTDRPAGPQVVPSGKGEAMLVAATEPYYRGMIVSFLRSQGYSVTAVADEAGVLREFRQRRDEMRLVIIDVDLLPAGGSHCLSELRRETRQLPVILLGDGVERDLSPDERVEWLPNTFEMARLAHMVHRHFELTEEEESES